MVKRMSELAYAQLSHVGKVRKHNEDRVKSDPTLGVWVLADGMGGLERGEVASQVTVDMVMQAVREGRSLEEAVDDAHRAVAIRAGGDRQRMGSTVVALRVAADRRFQVVWVGDSRAYLWRRASGELQQLTHDHSVAQRLADMGSITQDQVAQHPRRNVLTQAVGIADLESIQVAQCEGELGGDERLLLCSDGLSGELDDAHLAAILGRYPDPQAAAQALLEATLEAGANDNVSILIIDTPSHWPLRRESLARAFPAPVPVSGDHDQGRRRWLIAAACGVVLVLSLAIARWLW